MVVTGATSKQINNEKYMLPISYGSMLVETLVAILALIAVGSLAHGGKLPSGTPTVIFASGVSGFLDVIGLPNQISFTIVSLAVSSFVLTTLDTVARLGRLAFQELFTEYDDIKEGKKNSAVTVMIKKILASKPATSICTLLPAYLLAIMGYQNIWPLFGAANQLLAALTLVACALFLRKTRRKSIMLFIPAVIMMAVTFTSLVFTIKSKIIRISGGSLIFGADGLQLIIAVLLFVLGILVIVSCLAKMLSRDKGPETGV
jgi:carbon starvation protein